MRLIDADALEKKLEELRESYNKLDMLGAEHLLVHGFMHYVCDAPTIDPVRHGRWIVKWWDEDGDARDWACSVCGFSHVYFYDMPNNYCPNCGAKMDGGEDAESEE